MDSETAHQKIKLGINCNRSMCNIAFPRCKRYCMTVERINNMAITLPSCGGKHDDNFRFKILVIYNVDECLSDKLQ